MTQPENVGDLVAAGVGDTGLLKLTPWQLRPATVVVAGDASCVGLFAGEGVAGTASTAVPLISLVGFVPANTRVMVMIVPPSGNYIISRIFGASDSSWTDYTPRLTASVSNPDLGDGTITGRWLVVGWRTVIVEVNVTFGTPPNAGSGRYFISAPFTVSPRSILNATGACYMLDNGTANRAGIVNPTSGGTDYFITNTPNGDVSNNVPHIWFTGDQIRFTITHEVASFDPL